MSFFKDETSTKQSAIIIDFIKTYSALTGTKIDDFSINKNQKYIIDFLLLRHKNLQMSDLKKLISEAANGKYGPTYQMNFKQFSHIISEYTKSKMQQAQEDFKRLDSHKEEQITIDEYIAKNPKKSNIVVMLKNIYENE